MKFIIKIMLFCVFINETQAQTTEKENPLVISGYADTYWKYDFSGKENIGTYFANDQNSISLGMLALGLKKTTGRATFMGELSFGPRGQYLSIPTGDNRDKTNSFHIQNLYMTYDFTDKFSMTAGYMGTFVGYEVISPASNFHYSTSYLFGAGPFQNAGVKATYSFSPKVSIMAGLFNDWNVYQDLNGLSHFGAQLALQPTDNLQAYINVLTGSSSEGKENYSSGTLVDFVASYSITDKTRLAVNAADYKHKGGGGYSGVAVYPQYTISPHFDLGLRAEYFKPKEEEGAVDTEEQHFTSFTLSGKIKHGGLSVIPEVRLDHAPQKPFLTHASVATAQASQFSLALVYAF